MNLQWINPLFLPLLALGAVPVLIHLFARAKARVWRFSNLAFLQPLVRSRRRMKRPHELLLLLLRVLVLLLLVAAFARPRLYRGFMPNAGQPRTVILVVDATASMRVVEGGQTRFSSAAARADRILGSLRPRDRANLVWIRRSPEAVFEAPGVNVAHLRQTLRKAQASYEAASPEAALRMAVDQIRRTETGGDLVLVSDFQSSAWKKLELSLPSSVHLTTVQVGAKSVSNIALTDLTVDPPSPTAGEPVRVRCEVRNFGDTPVNTQITLGVGEQRHRRELNLEPHDTSIAAFRCSMKAAGQKVLLCRIGDDAFPADNQRSALVQVQPDIPVRLVSRDDDNTREWQQLLSCYPNFAVQRDPTVPPRNDADVLVLADWEGGQEKTVEQFLKDGGLVVWELTGKARRPALDFLGLEDSVKAMSPVRDREEKRVAPLDEADDVLQVFRSGSHGDLAAVRFREWLPLVPARVRGLRPVLQFPSKGHCALGVIPRGRGRLVVWNMPLAESKSDFALHGEELVQLFGEVVRQWRPDPVDSFEARPGETQSYRLQAGGAENLRFVNRQDEELPLRFRSTPDGPVALSAPVPSPGLYQWMRNSHVLDTVPVNLDPVESDLARLPADQLPAADGAAPNTVHADLRWMRDGQPLWPWLLLAAAGAVAAESAVLFRSVRGKAREEAR